MLLDYIKRGNLVAFTAEPKDADGNPVAAESVTLYISYVSGTDRDLVSVEMETDTDGLVWAGEWDSSVATKGRVHWHVRSDNPTSAKEGQFELEANLANPEPESA